MNNYYSALSRFLRYDVLYAPIVLIGNFFDDPFLFKLN